MVTLLLKFLLLCLKGAYASLSRLLSPFCACGIQIYYLVGWFQLTAVLLAVFIESHPFKDCTGGQWKNYKHRRKIINIIHVLSSNKTTLRKQGSVCYCCFRCVFHLLNLNLYTCNTDSDSRQNKNKHSGGILKLNICVKGYQLCSQITHIANASKGRSSNTRWLLQSNVRAATRSTFHKMLCSLHPFQLNTFVI